MFNFLTFQWDSHSFIEKKLACKACVFTSVVCGNTGVMTRLEILSILDIM